MSEIEQKLADVEADVRAEWRANEILVTQLKEARAELDAAHAYLNSQGVPNVINAGPEARLMPLLERLRYMVSLKHHIAALDAALEEEGC